MDILVLTLKRMVKDLSFELNENQSCIDLLETGFEC